MSKSVEMLKKIVDLKPGGEVREQQQVAVEEIEKVLQEKKHLLLEAPTGSGKALHVDTPILTVDGWKTMGELTEDDKVYGTNGKPTQVVKAHTPFLSEKLYRVTFSNGESIYADSDHLWQVQLDEASEPPRPLNQARLTELANKAIYIDLHDTKRVPANDIRSGEQSFPAEIILNAASFCDAKEETEEYVVFNAENYMEELYIELLNREATWKTEDLYTAMLKSTTTAPQAMFKVRRGSAIELHGKKLPAPARFFGEWLTGQKEVFTKEEYKALKKAGVADNQSIPDMYKNASFFRRRELLIGLLHGRLDGTFLTTVKTLAEDVQYIASSLGLSAALMETKASDNKVIYSVQVWEESLKDESIVSIELVKSAMVRCITVDAEDHLFLAGRTLIPTHNTLSYLIPLLEENPRAVISTATKQLSEQIINTDIKFLNKALKEMKAGKRVKAVLLKGRDNYLCLAKHEDMRKLSDTANTLFGVEDTLNAVDAKAQQMGKEAASIAEWAEETKTGDRSEAPAVSDEIWRQYSSTNVECPGKASCPFGDVCFAEEARDKAKEAQIVVTNHAIVALDLASEGQLLGDRDVFVFDELHELDTYVSSAWGAELTYKRLESTHKLLKSIPSLEESNIEELKKMLDEYEPALRSVEVGLIENDDMSVKLENYITRLYNVSAKIITDVSRKEKESSSDALKRIYTGAKKVVTELNEIASVLSDSSIETVRWTVEKKEKKTYSKKVAPRKAKNVDSSEGSNVSLHAAPLRYGPKLQKYLEAREATMIGLSATVTVLGKMDIPLHNFGLEDKPHHTVILDSPYDFKKQAMMYIPNPATFPLPVGEERIAHSKAVKEDSVDLIKAAGGRALVLSTTSQGVTDLVEYYREKLPKVPFLAQGDAPNSQLVETFKNNHETALVGTMGFWHGLDAPGSTLILVVIDKLPFPSPGDPLLLARKNYADKLGRNGFMEIYVTIADWMARQGFGRAIRTKTDRAVVAFYDKRLVTKNYGRAILNNLHGVGIFHDRQKVLAALERLRSSVE